MNRYLGEKIFKILSFVSLLLVILSLLIIIIIVLYKGGRVLITDPKVVITPPEPRYLLGGEGGFFHALVGSIYLALPATIIASVLGVIIAVSLQTDYMQIKYADKIRVLLEILWGTPSIVLGIFVMTILIYFKQRGCLLAGIMTLMVLELPIITRYADEAIYSVPRELKEAVYAMGTTRWEASVIMVKYAFPGILAGILMGLGRGIGDAAAVIFTAGSSNSIPRGLFESVSALPVLIFQQASAFHSEVRADAYAASFVLLLIIILINIVSRMSVRYFSKYIQNRDG